MMLVDSHCHLDYPDFQEDFAGVLSRAAEAGVGTMLTIGTSLETFDRVLAVAEAHDNIYCTVGIHPHEAGKERTDVARLVELAKHPKVLAFGETGLDYFYDHSPREAQRALFRTHIAAAREADLPVIIHSRSADSDTGLIIAAEMSMGPFRGLIHCFSSGRDLAERALKKGLYLSLSGIITFTKNDDLIEVIQDIPLDRLMVETDAPYLSPAPYRGKRNEPSYVLKTAEKLAEIKRVNTEVIAKHTTENFFQLFTKAKR